MIYTVVWYGGTVSIFTAPNAKAAIRQFRKQAGQHSRAGASLFALAAPAQKLDINQQITPLAHYTDGEFTEARPQA